MRREGATVSCRQPTALGVGPEPLDTGPFIWSAWTEGPAREDLVQGLGHRTGTQD